MTDIINTNFSASYQYISHRNQDTVTLQKPAPLDDQVADQLATQLQMLNPAIVEQLTTMLEKINRQAISEEEKKALIIKEYNLAIKEFSTSLNSILQQAQIIPSYKNKNQVLAACSQQLNHVESSDSDHTVLRELINKTSINLIGLNGLMDNYKLQVFGLSDDGTPKLDDFII